MKYNYSKDELRELLSQDRILSVRDFAGLFKCAPMTTVYARIRGLIQEGIIIPVGKGMYTTSAKPEYLPAITPGMLEINQYLIDTCEGINFCLSDKGNNILLSARRSDIDTIVRALKSKGEKTVLKKDADRLAGELEGFIIIEPMVSEAPIVDFEGISTPSIEKEIVDRVSNSKGQLNSFDIQKIAEVYPINKNRLARYAARRGVSDEVNTLMDNLNANRIDMFSKVQRYLPKTKVTRAWVFGSFSRGEERADSDLDLLVDYDKSNHLSLLTIIRYKLDLEDIIGREVDLVENGCLKPFAVPSAERDKYLIYEKRA